MGIMKKVNPMNIDLLKHIFGIICSLNKEEYKDLTFETFLECRDCIYIYTDKCYEFGEYPCIEGIIACRRTDMNNININNLRYYCKKNNIVYSIECLHVFNHNNNKLYLQNIVKGLIEVCSKDKNDAFIILKQYSSDGHIYDYLKDELLIQGFYSDTYVDNTYTLVKPPITY